MGNATVSWAELSERARQALTQRRTVAARVRGSRPPAGRNHGDAVESMMEVRFARPDLWRVELDGELVLLRDGIRHLTRATSGAMQRHLREPNWIPGDEIGGLGWGHADLFGDPPAFEAPLSGPIPTTVADRCAWEVLLGAPGKKPYVLRLALDRETGLVLRYAAEGTPYVVEVLDITIDEELSAGTFDWHGDLEDRRAADARQARADD